MDGLHPLFRTWPVRDLPWLVLDFVVAAALVAVSVTGAAARTATFGPPAWLTITAAVLVAAPVAVRRVWPVTVLAVVLAASCVLMAGGVGGAGRGGAGGPAPCFSPGGGGGGGERLRDRRAGPLSGGGLPAAAPVGARDGGGAGREHRGCCGGHAGQS